MDGSVPVYFEAAGRVITVLVLLGPVLELPSPLIRPVRRAIRASA
jgi:hypothetical protein